VIHETGGKQLLCFLSAPLVGAGKDPTKKPSPSSRVKVTLRRAGRCTSCEANTPVLFCNKKLGLKSHFRWSHDCIVLRYQLSDVMSDPAVAAPAAGTIDPAVAAARRREGGDLGPMLLCLFPLHPSGEL